MELSISRYFLQFFLVMQVIKHLVNYKVNSGFNEFHHYTTHIQYLLNIFIYLFQITLHNRYN